MSFALPFRLPASRYARVICLALVLATAGAAIYSFHRRPRPWRVDEVPIAFWGWRNQTPAQADVRAAIEAAKARTMFLRAGQIDYQDGKLRRIRAITGSFPAEIELHLVYNATQSLLSRFELVEEEALAASIATAYREDVDRAARDHARVSGLQIDFDMPTRLLGRYQRILRSLRAHLKPGAQLSITGLPTWMQSPELPPTLEQVDFWIPQFYGARVPERADQLIPISSPPDIQRFLNGARALDKPFYAGLAAYSWALLYGRSGSLITLRGDMDPAAVAIDANLELIDRQMFDATPGEWRYAYRARADGVTDGLAMKAGDVLVLDMPSAESLRESARLVRALAGERLLGICVFRLPARDDPAALTIEEVAAGLADKEAVPDLRMHFRADERHPAKWFFAVENKGSTGVMDLKIDIPVEAGTIASVDPQRGVSSEPICHVPNADKSSAYQRCGQNRANLIRFVAAALRPGQSLVANIALKSALPKVVWVAVETQANNGQPYQARQQIPVESRVTQ